MEPLIEFVLGESRGYGEEKCFEILKWRRIGNESVDTDVAELLSKSSERK